MKKILNIILCSVMLLGSILTPLKAAEGDNRQEIDNNYVQKADFTTFNKKIENDEYYEMLKTGLLNANKYALTTWFNEKKNLDEDTGTYWNLKKASGNSGTNEYIYRFPAAEAFGIAISLKTGAYDEKYVGVDKETAKEIAIKLATSVAYGHKENGGNYASWGDDWQAAHWAFYAGYAAWLFWDDLTTEDQTMIQKMIVYEANRFNNTNAVYWKTPNGTELYAGDSKIEEDAWNSELMNFAVQMMPKHENRGIWEYRSIEYQLAAFSTPEMTKSNELIHGREAKDWIYGYNVNDDGTVINHGIVHPTYNAASTGVNMSIVNTLVHEKLPIAAKYNLDKLYGGLTDVDFKVEDGYKEPGGTIYIPGTPEIYYPQGNDWGTGVYDVYLNIDTSAYIYGFGENADAWAKLHTQRVLDQQARHEDGHAYANNGENSYLGKEEAISTRFGCALMTYWLNYQEPVAFDNDEVTYPHEELPPLSENEIRIPVSDATYVRGGSSANTNYYTTDVLEVKNDGGPESSYTREAYMKFDFNSIKEIPQKAIIDLSTVKVGSAVEANQVENVVELIANNDWHADTLTFNNKPEATGIVLGKWIPNENGLQIDVTKYIQQAAAQDKKLSLRIYSTVNKGGDTYTFYGSDRQANPNFIPNLILSYSDELTSVIKGSENVNRNDKFELSYMLSSLRKDKEYRANVDVSEKNFVLENIQGANGVNIKKATEILPGRYCVDFTVDKNFDKVDDVLKLNLLAAASGVKTVSINLYDTNGTNLNTAVKTMTVKNPALTGEFIGEEKKVISNDAIADTTLRYGDETPALAESNGKKVELDCKTYSGANARQTLVKFNLADIGNIADAESVKVKLSVVKTPNVPASGDPTYRFQAVESNWNEYEVTWNTKPDSVKDITQDPSTMPAADENTLLETKVRAPFVELDVTEYAKNAVAKGEKEMSVFVYALESTNTSVVFASREHTTIAHPQITATYPVEEVLLKNEMNSEVNYGEMIESLFKITGISDLSNPEIEISYDADILKFEKLDFDNALYNIELIENNPGKLRVKVKKANTQTAFSDQLFKILWSSKREGDAVITSTTNSNQTGEMTSVATIKIKNKDYTVLQKHVEKLYNLVNESKKLRNNFSVYMFMNMDTLLQKCDDLLARDIKTLTEDEVAYYIQKIETEKSVLDVYSNKKEALKVLIDENTMRNKDDYTAESWENFAVALKTVKNVLDDPNASIQQLDEAIAMLNRVADQLVKKTPSKPVDPVVPVPPTDPMQPEEPKAPDAGNSQSPNNENEVKQGVDTGDQTNALFYITIAMIAGCGLILVFKKLKKQDNAYNEIK